MKIKDFNFVDLDWLELLAIRCLMTEKDGLTYREFYGRFEVMRARVDELLEAGVLIACSEEGIECFYLSEEAKVKVFDDFYTAYHDLRRAHTEKEVKEEEVEIVSFEKGFLFSDFLFRESEILALAKNFGYWKSSKEGSLLAPAFTPERLKDMVSAGFLMHEPGVSDSYLVAEKWRDEFFAYLESNQFTKEIDDTIRRGY